MRLDVKNLAYRRGSFSLDVSFGLESGRTGVIVGPSGCGKTTLLRLLAGLERPDSGSIVLGGRKLDGLPPERRKVGFVFQDLALFDHMDGCANIAYGLRARGVSKKEAEAKVRSLADSLRIRHLLDRRPPDLSGGERQRLAFARALAAEPDLMLLDEPLSSLDASLRKELRAFLRAHLASSGTTALHVTHDVEEALELADTVFVMRAGRIVANGEPEALFADPPDAWTARFLGIGPLIPAVSTTISASSVIPVIPPGPADARANAGGRINLATVFGSFSVPASGDRRVSSGLAPEPATAECFLHFPRNAATVAKAAGTELAAAPIVRPQDAIHFEAVLERSIFEGDSRRLVFDVPGSDASMEVTAPVDFACERGETVRLSIAPENLRILSPEPAA